ERGRVFYDAEYFEACCSGCRLPNHRRNPANDKVPVLTQVDGHDRLDVEHILSAIKRSDAKVAVVLERNADKAGNGVLRGLLKVFGRASRIAGGSALRVLRRKRHRN